MSLAVLQHLFVQPIKMALVVTVLLLMDITEAEKR